MAQTSDFIVKNGLQVIANVAIGAFATTKSPPSNGLIVSGSVGIGTATGTVGNILVVASGSSNFIGNIIISNAAPNTSGIQFSDGTFQSTASTGLTNSINSVNASNITITTVTSSGTYYPTFVSGTTGNLTVGTNSYFTINPSTGTITSGIWAGAVVNVGVGGTGLTNIPTNAILVGYTNGAIGQLQYITYNGTSVQGGTAGSGNVLLNTGGVPNWGALTLSSNAAVTGVLGLSNGGTNSALTAQNGGIVYSTTGNLTISNPSALFFNNSSGYLGINTNAPSQYLDVNGAVLFRSNLAILSTTASTGLGTGALTVNGGGSVAGNLYVGGNLTVSGNLIIDNTYINNIFLTTTDTVIISNANSAVSSVSGALQVLGGAGIGGNIFVGNSLWAGNASITNTTATTSGSTGALTVAGGVGIAGNLFTSASAWHGNLSITNSTVSTSTTSGALQVLGGAGIGGNIFVGNSLWAGNASITNTTAASSSSSTIGALTIAGGAGIASGLTTTGFVNFIGSGSQEYTVRFKGSSTGDQFAIATSGTAGFGIANDVLNSAATAYSNYTISASTVTFKTGASSPAAALSITTYGNSTFAQNLTVSSSNISTNTSTGALIVAGGVGIAGNLYASSNVVAASFQPTGLSVPPNGMYLPNTNTLSFATNNTQRATIAATGQFLIGTSTAPAGTGVWEVINNATGGGTEWVFNNSGGGNIAGSSGGGLVFSTFTGAIGSESYTQRMQINSSGNVGIGTTTISAGNALAVYGGGIFLAGNLQVTNTATTTSGIKFADGTYMTTAAVNGAASTMAVTAITTNATYFPVFVAATSGAQPQYVSASLLNFNPSNGNLTVNGNITLSSSGGQNVTATGTSLTLQQTGDTYGTTGLTLENRLNLNGALFFNAGLDLVDFGYLSSSGAQYNTRFEHRSSSLANTNNARGEYQIVDILGAGNRQFPAVFGQSAIIFAVPAFAGGAASSALVGINTLTPKNQLDVNGNMAIGSYAGVSNAPINGAIISGNVGIGTSSIIAGNIVAVYGGNLFVAGNIRLGNTATQIGGIQFSDGTFQSTAPTAATITDDTTTNAPRYINFTSTTSGTLSTINTSSTRLTYYPVNGNVVVGGNLTVSGANGISSFIGNVGIGTTTAIAGYVLSVNGGLAATTKSFVIPHPTKPNTKLQYASLEGPENGVYIRGKLNDTNKIELPDYWSVLVDPNSITVHLTPIGKHQKLYVSKITRDSITVAADGLFGTSTVNCFYTVYAERRDVPKLQVEV